MTLDPRDRKSWQGFLDQLQPPSGYRLSAGLGTSFGLSIDALTAALLSMCDADGDALASDPVAGVLAITRLRSKVRVLVHPGTISGRVDPGSSRLVALLDRLIIEVQPASGLFHPKVWVFRFDRIGSSSEADAIGRVLVCSRNLSTSTAFEIGAAVEGPLVATSTIASPFAEEVAGAVHAWLTSGRSRVPTRVWQLPAFLRRVDFATFPQASEDLRFRWQGPGRKPLSDILPARIERAVVVSPFLRPDFTSRMAERCEQLHIVSTPEALDALDDETFAVLEAVQDRQQIPVLYQVGGIGEPEAGYIEGLHAKLVLTEDAKGRGPHSSGLGQRNWTRLGGQRGVQR